jgi:hypothetical protein
MLDVSQELAGPRGKTLALVPDEYQNLSRARLFCVGYAESGTSSYQL